MALKHRQSRPCATWVPFWRKPADYSDIVKTTVFVVDLGDFAAVNAVYERFFDSEPPARSCVQVAALPKGGLVEIECVAAERE